MDHLQRLIQMMFAAFNATASKRLTADNESSFVGSLLRSFAKVGYELLGANEVALDRLDISNATGTDLEALADNFALERNVGTPSETYVNLWVYDPNETRVLEAGTLVSTADGVVFETLRDCVLLHDPANYPFADVDHPDFTGFDAIPTQNGFRRTYAILIKDGVTWDPDVPGNEQLDASKEIPVRSIDIGADRNVDALEITIGPTFLGGNSPVTSVEDGGVENALPATGGSDEENDEVFRKRIQAHLAGTSTTTRGYLEAAALIPGVDDAKSLEPEDQFAGISPPPGAVYIIVASTRRNYDPKNASTDAHENEVRYPSSSPVTIKEKIRNLLEDYRSVGVGVVVREAEVVQINFKSADNDGGEMLVYVRPGTNLVTYTADIEARLREYIGAYRIGQRVYTSEIVDVLRSVDAVVDIGPFDVSGTRWDYDNALETTSLASQARADIGRDAIVVRTEEVARPARTLRFRLVHSTPGSL